MSYFSTLRQLATMETRCQDIGTPTAPHSAPHCGSSSSSSNVANVLVVPVPPLPAPLHCYSSMSFPFHHCHNFVSQSLVPGPAYSPPRLTSAHDTSREGIIIMQFQCAKNGANFPGPKLLQSSYFSLSVISVRQIAFMALDKYSIIDRLNGIDSLRQ